VLVFLSELSQPLCTFCRQGYGSPSHSFTEISSPVVGQVSRLKTSTHRQFCHRAGDPGSLVSCFQGCVINAVLVIPGTCYEQGMLGYRTTYLACRARNQIVYTARLVCTFQCFSVTTKTTSMPASPRANRWHGLFCTRERVR
jgi:hypothetical protein